MSEPSSLVRRVAQVLALVYSKHSPNAGNEDVCAADLDAARAAIAVVLAEMSEERTSAHE